MMTDEQIEQEQYWAEVALYGKRAKWFFYGACFLIYTVLPVVIILLASNAQGQHYHPGTQQLKETWVSSQDQGWHIGGSGSCTPLASLMKSSMAQHATRFTIDKEVSPAFLAQGAHWVLKDLTFYGWGGGVGIHVNDTRKEFNGTKGIIQNVSLGNFETGILLSEQGQHGNDNLVIRDCHLGKCDVAIEIAANQAVHTLVDNLNAAGCKTVLLCSGGADVTLRHVDVKSSAKLVCITADGSGVAENNGTVTLIGIRADNISGSTFTIIEPGNEHARYNVLVEDLRLPAKQGKKLRATLTGKSQRLHLNHVYNMPKDTILDPGPGTIVVENCRLPVKPSEMLPKTSAGEITFVNCEYKNETITGSYRN